LKAKLLLAIQCVVVLVAAALDWLRELWSARPTKKGTPERRRAEAALALARYEEAIEAAARQIREAVTTLEVFSPYSSIK
jgi:hypothetical protein